MSIAAPDHFQADVKSVLPLDVAEQPTVAELRGNTATATPAVFGAKSDRLVLISSVEAPDGSGATRKLTILDRATGRETLARAVGGNPDAALSPDGGTLVIGPSQAVEQFPTTWLADVVAHTVRESTHESYAQMVRCHVLPKLGKTKLTKLTAQHLAALYALKLAEGLSARSVQYLRAILHRALKQAVRWNLVARNVADLVDAPRPKRTEIRPLSPRQVQTLVGAAKGDRLEALYVLAVSTGLRQGELLGLGWADVDLDSATIRVSRQLSRAKGKGYTFGEPKTARGRRGVTLPAFAVAALREHRRRQLEERLRAGSEWADIGLVFTNLFGRPLEPGNVVRRSFVPLLAQAGCPRVRFHDLRHTAATLLLAQGEHPKVVQERLGHSTIAVTMDV